jgi:hypothetical protein
VVRENAQLNGCTFLERPQDLGGNRLSGHTVEAVTSEMWLGVDPAIGAVHHAGDERSVGVSWSCTSPTSKNT